MSKKLSFFILLGFLLCIPLTTLAIEKHASKVVFLAADQTVNQNYYAAGEKIEIYGTINGDLFLAASEVVIDSANINGDIFVVSEKLVVKNKINGSIRAVVAKEFELNAEVVKNVFVLGSSLKVAETAQIAQHLTFWGSNLEFNGKVGQNLEGGMENLSVNGQVGANVDVYLSPRDEANLQLTDKALVSGSVFYRALTTAQVAENAQILGALNFEKWTQKFPEKNIFDHLWSAVVTFFSMLVVGMVLFYLWPGFFSHNFATLRKQSWKTLLFGFLFLFLTPFVALLLMFTVIGLPVGLMILAAWVVFLYLAAILSAWLLGKFIKNKFLAKYPWSKMHILAFGIVVYLLIGTVPFLGWLLLTWLYLLAWGLLWSKIKIKK